MRNILVDTGVVIGLLDSADRFHHAARGFFSGLRPTDRLATTWPVVTECMFALEHVRDELFQWLMAGEVEVMDFSVHDLDWMWRWMKGFRARQIDFADASLVWLAVQRRTTLIATTDFNDFDVYRLPGKKAFKNLITRHPTSP